MLRSNLSSNCKPQDTMSSYFESANSGSSSNISSLQEILEKYWQNGLREYGTMAAKEQLLEVCRETGWTSKQVKVWINNRKRKQITKAGSFKLHKRKTSGYAVFRKKYLEGKKVYSKSERGKLFRDTAKKWQQLSEVEKQKFKAEGDAINKGKPFETLSAEEVTKMRQAVMRDAKKLHEKAKLLHLEFLSIYIDPDSGSVTKDFSERGKKFSEVNFVSKKFANFVNFSIGTTPITHENLDRAVLMKRLQDSLNERARDCLGVRKVPYKRIRSGEVKVTGLPDGVAFKSPSTYGISMLQKLTDQSSAIIFREVNNDGEDTKDTIK